MAEARPGWTVWLTALWLFLLTDPLYPLLIRGWSEWATDYEGVRAARRMVWAAHYAAMAALLAVWLRGALAVMGRIALLPAALAWFGASALWSETPGASALGFAQFALTLGFGMAAGARLGPAVVAQAVFRAGVICALASWVVAMVAPLYGFGQHVNPGALRGVYAEKNHLAIFLSLAIAAGLFEALSSPRRRVVGGLALLVATQAAAQSSIGLGMLALAGLAAALFFGLGRGRYAGFAALAIGVSALLALAAALPAALAALGEEPTLNGRTELWALLWPLAEARPLLGYGFAGFWESGAADDVRTAIAWNVRGAHSGWLETLLAGGAVGAALWLGVWATVGRRALAALRPGADPARGTLALIGLTHLAWSCFESHQMGHLSYHPVISGLVFSLAAAGAAAGAAPRLAAVVARHA